MNRILVVDDDKDIREITVMIIKSRFNLEVIEAVSGNDAVKILKETDDIGLVLCDFRMMDGNGDVVYSYLMSQRFKIPFVLISTNSPNYFEIFSSLKEDNPLNDFLEKPFTAEGLIKVISRSYVSSFDDESAGNSKTLKELGALCRVRKDYILEVDHDSAIFIKLSSDKFICVREKGDNLKSNLEKYIDRGVQDFYLNADEFLIFTTKLMEKICLLTNADDFTFTDEFFGSEKKGIEFVHELVREVGFKESSVELIDKMIDTTLQTIRKNSHLNEILMRLEGLSSYIYEHAYLSAYLSCSIAEKTKWYSESLWQKLIYASLFQNVALYTDEEAKIYDISSYEFTQLKLDSRLAIKDHMFRAAQILENFPNFNEDVKNIILNHHELPNGKGFPRGLNASQVSPIDALFVLAINLSHRLILSKERSKAIFQEIVNEFKKDYDQKNYKYGFSALKKCLPHYFS